MGDVIESAACSEIGISAWMKFLEAEQIAGSFGIFRVKFFGWSHVVLEMPLEDLNILVISFDGVMFHDLFFFDNLLVIVAIPEVVVATDVFQNL